MCWISNKCNPLVSDGNVKIIKICGQKANSHICGYFRTSFNYILNFTYKTEVKIHKSYFNNDFYGYEGFHCYSADTCTWKSDVKKRVIKIGTYSDSLTYFASYPMDYANFSNVVIVEGYIPKGTVYYIGIDGEIISNSIVLTKIIQTI